MKLVEFNENKEIILSRCFNPCRFNAKPENVILEYHQNGVYTGKHEWMESETIKEEHGEDNDYNLSCSMNIKVKVLFKDENLLVLSICEHEKHDLWFYPEYSKEFKRQYFIIADCRTNSELTYWGKKTLLIRLQSEKSYVIGQVDHYNNFVMRRKITEIELFEGLFDAVRASLGSWSDALSQFVSDFATENNITSYFLNNKKEAFG